MRIFSTLRSREKQREDKAAPHAAGTRTSQFRDGACSRYASTLLAMLAVSLLTINAVSQPTSAPVATNQFHHTVWPIKDGMPRLVSDMVQTSDGYLWIADETGLYRFDGVRFVKFTPASGPPLPTNSVMTVGAGSGGTLLIGWRLRGVSVLKNGQLTNYGVESGLPGSTVYNVVEDGAGRLWAATQRGLFVLQKGQWSHAAGDWGLEGPDEVNDLFIDTDGSLWVANGDSIFTLRAKATKFTETKVAGGFKTFQQSADGVIWVSDHSGNLSSVQQNERLRKTIHFDIPADTRNHVFLDRDGNIWAEGTKDLLLFSDVVKNGREGTVPISRRFLSENGELSGHQVRKIMQDREGNIWIATKKGIDRFRKAKFTTIDLPDEGVNMSLVARPGGQAVIGFMNDTASVQRPRPLVLGPHTVLPTFVSCTYTDTKGVSWIGGRKDFWRLDEHGFTSVDRPHKEGDTQAITGDGSDGLWVAIQRGGLYHFKDGAWTERGNNAQLPHSTVISEMTETNGNVWFGSLVGTVARLEPSGAVRVFSEKEGMKAGAVTAIYQHGDDIWIGGEKGLFHYDNGNFKAVVADGTEPLSGVSGIVQRRNGDLWLNEAEDVRLINASELRKFRANPAQPVQARVFNSLDGLTGGAPQLRPIPTALETDDGKLWFALGSTVATIDPDSIPFNSVPPPMAVEMVTADDQELRDLSKPKTRTDPQTITISYSAQSLAAPERVLFRYKLDGVDDRWQDVGTRRQAFYTKLHPGHYHFTVIASNEDGVWNNTGASIDFYVPPTFFETVTFKLLCLAVLALAVYLFVRWRIDVFTRQTRAQLSERVVERERIARELHDTLLQGVQGLILKFQIATQKIPKDNEARMMMEAALDRADQVMIEGRQRVRDLRYENVRPENLIDALQTVGHELAIDCPSCFTIRTLGEVRKLHPVVQDEVFLIGKEAITNAFQHSNGSNVFCELVFGEKQFTIRIQDDGKGFDPELIENGRPGHWGLRGMRERAKQIDGTCSIAAAVDTGATVEVSISSRSAYEKEANSVWPFSSKRISIPNHQPE